MPLCDLAVKSFGFCTTLACMLYIPGPMGRFRWFLSLGYDIHGPTLNIGSPLESIFFMADWEVIFPTVSYKVREQCYQITVYYYLACTTTHL